MHTVIDSCGFMHTTLLGVSVFEKCRKEERKEVRNPRQLLQDKDNYPMMGYAEVRQ